MSSGASNPSSSNKRTSQAAAVSSRGPSSAAATGRSRSGIAPPAASAISATASSNSPEEYWRNGVLAEVSPQQIGFLAEGLFKELWSRCGKDIAVNQISLMVAEVQFARGFDLLYKIHDNEAALIEFKKCLKIREHILGNDHRDTGKTYCFVGHTLREKRDYDNSLGQYRSALRILVALLR